MDTFQKGRVNLVHVMQEIKGHPHDWPDAILEPFVGLKPKACEGRNFEGDRIELAPKKQSRNSRVGLSKAELIEITLKNIRL